MDAGFPTMVYWSPSLTLPTPLQAHTSTHDTVAPSYASQLRLLFSLA